MCISARRNQLRHDRDRNLLRCDRANLQSHGRVHVLKLLERNAFFFKFLVNRDHLTLRPDHANIASRRAHRPAQYPQVIAMSAGHDHDISRLADLQPLAGLVKIIGNHLACCRKTLPIRITVAIVHNRNIEACNLRHMVEAIRHVACAEDVKQRRRLNGFNENFQCPATDQPGIVFGILIEIEGQCSRLLALHHFAGCLPDLGLDASATDRPDNRPIIAHQHLGRTERRNRSAYVDNGRHRAAASLASQFDDFLVEVHRFIIGRPRPECNDS